MFDFLPFFTVLVGFIVTFLSGYFVIPFLKKLKFGQTIREEGRSMVMYLGPKTE